MYVALCAALIDAVTGGFATAKQAILGLCQRATGWAEKRKRKPACTSVCPCRTGEVSTKWSATTVANHQSIDGKWSRCRMWSIADGG